MNFLNLGLRNLLGVLLPGSLVVLVLIACLGLMLPDLRPLIAGALTEKATFATAAVLLVSYVIGSVIRLYAADPVDRLSARLVRLPVDPFEGQAGSIQEHLSELLAKVTSPSVPFPPTRGAAKWAWKHDEFPFPVWECMKFRLSHPSEMFAFYQGYISCFATGDRRGKEFFNYCKSVIFSANEGRPHALADEVQAAEANVRFLAGTFWATVVSFSALSATSVVLGLETNVPKGELSAIISAAIMAASVAFAIVAGGRFRLYRLKEVDTVFDAFYLIHRHAAQCPQCNRTPLASEYYERRSLVEDAFASGMSLDRLTALMRLRSQENPIMSSLYFAGADRDHPYFLETPTVAVGIAVLPEDEPKSSIAKRHKHQRELIVVLEGELRVDLVKDGTWVTSDLAEGQVKEIAPGECHKILSKDKKKATFLFIKTHPAVEPRGERCSEIDEKPNSADAGESGD